MAKRKRNRGRVVSNNTNQKTNYLSHNIYSINLPVVPRRSSHIDYLNKLIRARDVEDRRRWSPSPSVARNIYGSPVKTIQIKPNKSHWIAGGVSHPYIYRGPNLRPIRIVPPNSVLAKRREGHGPLEKVLRERIGFDRPHEVMICVRRKQRREMMFVMKMAGGAGRAKKLFKLPKRNFYSGVDC